MDWSFSVGRGGEPKLKFWKSILVLEVVFSPVHIKNKPFYITDIDECLEDKGGCEHYCVNVLGDYYCECKDGFVLGKDKYDCLGR